jgi:starch synthase
MMKVVLIASEIAPLSKTGGMGDVVGALAVSLAEAGHHVLTVSPKYGTVDVSGFARTDQALRVDVGGRTHTPRVWVRHTVRRTDVLIESHLFDRNGIYGDAHGAFGDNHLRFALLSRAGIEAARHVPAPDAPMGEDVVFHVHDWHTALVPVYLNALYRPLGLFARAATVLTLHNVAHQGAFSAERFADLELPPRWNGGWCLEWHGGINLLKGGILQAEALTTVSPSYARELLLDGAAMGLEASLRHRVRELVGIVNGIDDAVWDPQRDPYLDAPFSADDLSGKAVCKAALQREFGLPVDASVPVLASVGRLDPQKGVGLLLESIPWVVEAHGAQVVLVGSAGAAHRAYEHQLRSLEARYPRNVRAFIGFSERMAHRVEAGADAFLMPSLFEPCGLNQLYSLRYGTPPIVHRVGGLKDTVTTYDPQHDTGNGWTFDHPIGEAFREAIHWALVTYKQHPEVFGRLRARGMREDHAWRRVLPAYEHVYRFARSKMGAGVTDETPAAPRKRARRSG